MPAKIKERALNHRCVTFRSRKIFQRAKNPFMLLLALLSKDAFAITTTQEGAVQSHVVALSPAHDARV